MNPQRSSQKMSKKSIADDLCQFRFLRIYTTNFVCLCVIFSLPLSLAFCFSPRIIRNGPSKPHTDNHHFMWLASVTFQKVQYTFCVSFFSFFFLVRVVSHIFSLSFHCLFCIRDYRTLSMCCFSFFNSFCFSNHKASAIVKIINGYFAAARSNLFNLNHTFQMKCPFFSLKCLTTECQFFIQNIS